MKRSIKLAMQSFVVATMLVMGCGVWALSSTPVQAGPKKLCDMSGGPSGCPPVIPGPNGGLCYAAGCDPASEGACLYVCDPPPQW